MILDKMIILLIIPQKAILLRLSLQLRLIFISIECKEIKIEYINTYINDKY